MRTLRKIMGALLVLSIAACFDVAVQAADSTPPGAVLPVLKLVPDDALAVVIINHLNQADEQVAKLAGEMQIPIPGLLSLLKMHAGIHAGVDDSGSAILALMPGAAEILRRSGLNSFRSPTIRNSLGNLNRPTPLPRLSKRTLGANRRSLRTKETSPSSRQIRIATR